MYDNKKSNNTIETDQSTKNHKSLSTYNVHVPKFKEDGSRDKTIVRNLGIKRVHKKTAEANFEAFQEICKYFDKIGKAYLFKKDEDIDLLKTISSSFTDNAADAKKFCKILATYSEDEAGFKKFYCNLHKLAICSRDTATLVKSFQNKSTFENTKSAEMRFDNYDDAFYHPYLILHRILPLDGLDANTVKASAIRFCTFDLNITVIYPIYDAVLLKLN